MATPRTALDVISAALKRLGVLSGIETPSADLASDGLDRLSSLLESWQTESLNIYALIGTFIVMTPGKTPYTLGPTGDFDGVRPIWIDHVTVQVGAATPPTETLLERLTGDQWAALPQKSLTGIPSRYYYDPAYPLGFLYPWPVPDGGHSLTLSIYMPWPLPIPLALTTLIDLPPGYYRAIRDNLALELAPDVGRQIDPMLLQIATEAKTAIKRVNTVHHVLRVDPALLVDERGGYDWTAE